MSALGLVRFQIPVEKCFVFLNKKRRKEENTDLNHHLRFMVSTELLRRRCQKKIEMSRSPHIKSMYLYLSAHNDQMRSAWNLLAERGVVSCVSAL